MKKQPLIFLSIFLILSILILFNNNFAPVKFVIGITQNIFSAPKELLYKIKTYDNNTASGEINKLKKENERLTEKLIELERISRDNEALRSQFEINIAKRYKMVPADVIGFLGRLSAPSSLIINAGEKDGIKSTMAVILGENLLGKIGSVSSNYSEVVLLINNNFSSLAKTAEGNAPGIIKGEEDFILFDRVATTEKISEGEIILTKGEIGSGGFGIPQGLIVGKITSVNKSESLPFQTAKIESNTQFARLNKVFVVLGL